jgi:hypothetical protein
MKRNGKGQFVKGKKSKAKKKAHKAHGLASARAEYMLQKPAKGDSTAKALAKIHHNQGVLAHGLTVVATKVAEHERVLVGAGLIARRGGAA